MRRFGVAAAALALVVAAAAFAQNASEEARKLAQRLGRERNVEGLQAIVDARNRELLEWYERGWRDTSQREQGVPVAEAIEAIIVKNYRDPVVGPPLRTLVSANWTPYRSRELFDLMFEEWRSGKERPTTYPIREGIFRTSLMGIEPPVLAWLAENPGPGEYDANAIMHFLSQRKYRPAVPVIARRLEAKAPGEGHAIVDWLLGIGSEDAAAAAVRRLAWLRDRSGGIEERAFIANRVARLPPTAGVDHDALREAIGPADLKDPRYAEAARMLADPRKHYGMQATQAREAELAKKRADLGARMASAERNRAEHPQRYVDAMQSFLAESARLGEEYRDVPSARGMQGEMAMAWLQLGNFVRFRLKDPRRAIQIYGEAERAGQGLAIFAQGDTWQFDLRDKPRALGEYRRNLEQFRGAQAKGGSGEAAFFEWGRRWLAHQVEWLESGRAFTGTIDRDDIGGAGILVMFGSGPSSKGDDAGIFPEGPLAQLPPSGWSLIRGASMLGGLPDAKSILAFLARNDPAGYASACFFGLVDLTARAQADESAMATRGANRMFGGSKALQDAKAQFLRERKINLPPLPPRQ